MYRGLFLLCGEAFREGASVSRVRDTEFGVLTQTKASATHNELITKLTNSGWKIDVAMRTYKTKFESMLLNFYNNVVYSEFTDTDNGSIRYAVDQAVKNTFKHINLYDYDFVFILRFDLYLKPLFIEKFDPNWNKITYLNAMHYITRDSVDIKLPHVSDPFVFIPKSYYGENGWKGFVENSDNLLFHTAVGYLVDNGLSINSIQFISDRTYPTNTIQVGNPYFILICRPEAGVVDEDQYRSRYNHEKIEFYVV
jgi:hypothetical protein